jgi:hypothetical protein
MRLPDFVLSMDCLAVIRITEPSFELRLVTDDEILELPHPRVHCDFIDGRRFGIVKWIGDPAPYTSEELDRFACRAAEYLEDRWTEDVFPEGGR